MGQKLIWTFSFGPLSSIMHNKCKNPVGADSVKSFGGKIKQQIGVQEKIFSQPTGAQDCDQNLAWQSFGTFDHIDI